MEIAAASLTEPLTIGTITAGRYSCACFVCVNWFTVVLLSYMAESTLVTLETIYLSPVFANDPLFDLLHLVILVEVSVHSFSTVEYHTTLWAIKVLFGAMTFSQK